MGTAAPSTGRTIVKYKFHWHVVFTHFPVSFFVGSFGFMILHLFTQTSCFELAAYIGLIVGAAFMVPTTLTGWFTWKGRYKGLRSKLFMNKVQISFAMIVISFALVIYRSLFQFEVLDILHNLWHVIYFLGVILLTAGAIAEGYYGGRLNHR
jgi:uncharacterized membrane protein